MAATKQYGYIIESLQTSQHLTDSYFIKGGYIVVNTIAERDALPIDGGTAATDGIIVKGSLVYVAGTVNKSYRYDGTAWVEDSSLPSVTSSDNGKVLTVSNGEWAPITPATPATVGTLTTTSDASLSTATNESLSGSVNLHKVSKTGKYTDLVDKPSDGSATIATESNSIVTLKAGVSQSGLTIGNSSGSDIALAKVAKTGSYNDLSNKPTIPTVGSLKTNNTAPLNPSDSESFGNAINLHKISKTGTYADLQSIPSFVHLYNGDISNTSSTSVVASNFAEAGINSLDIPVGDIVLGTNGVYGKITSWNTSTHGGTVTYVDELELNASSLTGVVPLSKGGTGVAADDSDTWYTSDALHPHFKVDSSSGFQCYYYGPKDGITSALSALQSPYVQMALKSEVPVVDNDFNVLLFNGTIMTDAMDGYPLVLFILFPDAVNYGGTIVNGIHGTLAWDGADLYLTNINVNQPYWYTTWRPSLSYTSTPTADTTITYLNQTDGLISATASKIAITSEQVSKYATDATIANGDKLAIFDADSSNPTNQLKGSSITFDGSTTTQFLSKKGSWESIPSGPMVFRGTVGDSGAIATIAWTTLLSSSTIVAVGDTYKVVSARSTDAPVCKVGDTIICTTGGIGSSSVWTVIPSGDEPSGTVTNIATGTGLTGGPITSTGTISHADTSSQASVDNSGVTFIQDVTLDDFGHVTGLGSKTITKSDITGLGIPESDTNTTYSLSGALSNHKFTSTLTAGGSGSGTSTSDITLVAGSNVSLVDNTSERKITINATDTNNTYALNVSGSGDNATKLGLVETVGTTTTTQWVTIPYATSAGSAATATTASTAGVAGSANEVAWANVTGHANGVKADLGISSGGDASKFLNEQGSFQTVTTGAGAMRYKGTVGDSATITWANLINSSTSVAVGDTYKVVTARSGSPACKVGDMIIAVTGGTGLIATWEVIPSGDDVTGSGTSGSIAKWNGTSSLTDGPAFGSDTTKYLRNDGEWSTPPSGSGNSNIYDGSYNLIGNLYISDSNLGTLSTGKQLVVPTVDSTLDTTSSNAIANSAVAIALNNKYDKTGGEITGDVILYKAGTSPGDSYALIFQRGELNDTYNDWRIQDRSGYLQFDQRGSGSTAWSNVAQMTTDTLTISKVSASTSVTAPTVTGSTLVTGPEIKATTKFSFGTNAYMQYDTTEEAIKFTFA